MPLITPNTKDQLDMSAIPAGTYPCTIKEIEIATSKAGNNMLKVKVDVFVDGKPRPRIANLVTEGAGSGGFDSLLRAAKFIDTADKYKAGDTSIPFDTDRLLSVECLAVIVPNEYNGEMRDQISKFLAK